MQTKNDLKRRIKILEEDNIEKWDKIIDLEFKLSDYHLDFMLLLFVIMLLIGYIVKEAMISEEELINKEAERIILEEGINDNL